MRQASNSNVNGVYVYYRSGEHASTRGLNGAANLRGTTAARQDRWFVPGIRYPAGVYVGEGVAPVPKKVAEKIWRWDFVEMSELLQEFWVLAGEREGLPRRTRVVADIFTWVQCFTSYVSV